MDEESQDLNKEIINPNKISETLTPDVKKILSE